MPRFAAPLVAVCALAFACGSPGAEESTAAEATGSESTGEEATSSETGGGSEACVPLPADIVPVVEQRSLTAADGKQIAATVARPGEATCRPGLLLIHQYNRDRQQWAAQWSGVEPSFVNAGYVVLAIDLRGHGESDAQDGALADILTDPAQAPLDLAAGLDALLADPAVDPARVAVVGTSIGANLSVVGLHQHPELAAAVALSPRMDPVMSLADMPDSLDLRDLYCLAGELDGGGDQAMSCEGFVAAAGGASQAWIFEGTAAHGVALVDDFPETVPALLEWLEGVL